MCIKSMLSRRDMCMDFSETFNEVYNNTLTFSLLFGSLIVGFLMKTERVE